MDMEHRLGFIGIGAAALLFVIVREPVRRDAVGAELADEKAPSVYVANLPWSTTESDVVGLFAPYGDVHHATLITDRRTGRSRGFGFVDMPRPAARSAVNGLHGKKVGGRDLTVRIAEPRAHSS